MKATGRHEAGGPEGHLLLVEDDADTRFMLTMGLELNGFSVSQAENGRVALELLRRQRPVPWLVLLDLMMPEMNGLELLERMGDDPDLAGIPVILLSGVGEAPSGPRADRAVEFLRKPVGMSRLLRTVTRVLRDEQKI